MEDLKYRDVRQLLRNGDAVQEEANIVAAPQTPGVERPSPRKRSSSSSGASGFSRSDLRVVYVRSQQQPPAGTAVVCCLQELSRCLEVPFFALRDFCQRCTACSLYGKQNAELVAIMAAGGASECSCIHAVLTVETRVSNIVGRCFGRQCPENHGFAATSRRVMPRRRPPRMMQP